jgi:hypothetical protein
MRTIWSAVLALLVGASWASAQEAKSDLTYRFLFGGGYDAPTRLTGNVGMQWWRESAGSYPDGLIVETGVGQSGLRVSAGPFRSGEDAWVDVRGVLTRTWADPIWATSSSTYVGAEAGVTFMFVRVAAGVSHRVAGPDGPHGTVFTCGVQFVYWGQPSGTK